jgi:urease accessory protein
MMMDYRLIRELEPYQDEPRQLPSGYVGKSGFAVVEFERRGDRTIVASSYCRAPLTAHKALYWEPAMPAMACVYLIMVSGGMVQGDRHAIELRLGPAAQAHVTTQAATWIQEMNANFAAQTQRIELAEGAYLEYLPDMVIPSKHSRFYSETQIVLAPTATLLYSEVLMPGRKHKGGEVFHYDLYSSLVRAARPDGAELFVEKLVIEPWKSDPRQMGAMQEFDVLGNVLLLAEPPLTEQVLREVTPACSAGSVCAAAAGRLPRNAGIVYKVLGPESHVVLGKLYEFVTLARRVVLGVDAPFRRPHY